MLREEVLGQAQIVSPFVDPGRGYKGWVGVCFPVVFIFPIKAPFEKKSRLLTC